MLGKSLDHGNRLRLVSALDVLGWLESPCTVFRGSFGQVEGLVGLSDQGFEMVGLAKFEGANADSYPSGIANRLQNFSRLYLVQNLFGNVHCAVKIGVGQHDAKLIAATSEHKVDTAYRLGASLSNLC